MMAPATIGKLNPRAAAIPTSAIPIVLTVVQELPVANEIRAQIAQAEAKKKVGLQNLQAPVDERRDDTRKNPGSNQRANHQQNQDRTQKPARLPLTIPSSNSFHVYPFRIPSRTYPPRQKG